MSRTGYERPKVCAHGARAFELVISLATLVRSTGYQRNLPSTESDRSGILLVVTSQPMVEPDEDEEEEGR